MTHSINGLTQLNKKYFKVQSKYTKLYGEKTIVFFEMGGFYESFCTSQYGYSDLLSICQIIEMSPAHRESIKNGVVKPTKIGIPTISMKKNIGKLIDNGFTIVTFCQVVVGGEIDRVFSDVYTPGMYIPNKTNYSARNNMFIYIEESQQLNSVKILISVGITIIDVTTGKIICHDFHGKNDDDNFGLDELVRMLQTFSPIETVIYYHQLDNVLSRINNVKKYLEITKYPNCHFYIYNGKQGNDAIGLLNENSFKLCHQNSKLSDTFNINYQSDIKSGVSPIEVLGLAQKTNAVISLIIAIKYIMAHSTTLLSNLKYPIIYKYNHHLILGNNAIEQLNIIDSNGLEHMSKIGSVMDVIDKTTTTMGKRYLKDNLMNPLSQCKKSKIVMRYKIINEIIESNLIDSIKTELKTFFDIDRCHRQMALGRIKSANFYRLHTCYDSVKKIFNIVNGTKYISQLIMNDELVAFTNYQHTYQKIFNMEKMIGSDEIVNYFVKGVCTEIDELENKIDSVELSLELVRKFFLKYLPSNLDQNATIKIKKLELEGYFYTVTKKHELMLKAAFTKMQWPLKIKLPNGSRIKIKKDDFIFKQFRKSRTKIFISAINENSKNLIKYKNTIDKNIQEQFTHHTLEIYKNNKFIIHRICDFIAELDFMVGGAICAIENSYCEPIIPSTETIGSYVSASKLRHAIIEKICTDIDYIPNDIVLGNVPDQNNKNGILLFGVNAAGKSSFMKSIGIAIILAQIGYFVPAEKFIYEPYMSIYARITGNDNIFKGMSSYILELTELIAILTRSKYQGPNTMIIGDEVCRGTDVHSGISIVAKTIIQLSELNTSFIFSSHLHELCELSDIQQITNLRIYHLNIEFDTDNNIIFNRKMISGSGPKDYGIIIAKYLIKDQNFIAHAMKIKDYL